MPVHAMKGQPEMCSDWVRGEVTKKEGIASLKVRETIRGKSCNNGMSQEGRGQWPRPDSGESYRPNFILDFREDGFIING